MANPMTVACWIERLQTMPPDAVPIVCCDCGDGGVAEDQLYISESIDGGTDAVIIDVSTED